MGGDSKASRLKMDAKLDKSMGVKEDSAADKKMDRALGISEKDEKAVGQGGDNWIAGATKHKGALHAKLGVPEGEKIPAKKMAEAAHSSDPTERKEASLAKTLKSFGKGGDTMNNSHINRPNAEGMSRQLGVGGAGPVRRLGNKTPGGRHPGGR